MPVGERNPCLWPMTDRSRPSPRALQSRRVHPRPAVLDLIGNTPLVQVTRLDTGPCTLFLKLESQNPGGSIKDRIGLSMIEAAERDGRLKPGGTVVEATAGNTGLGPGAGRARQGLPRRAGRARQDVDREGAAPEGARRRGAHDALATSARAIPTTTRTWPRGSRARSPARSSPTSSTTRPTRWRTRPAPAPRSGQQMRPRRRRDRRAASARAAR